MSVDALKDRRLNIRLSSKDLEAIQTRALAEGLPYETQISSLLHKYASGRLKNCDCVIVAPLNGACVAALAPSAHCYVSGHGTRRGRSTRNAVRGRSSVSGWSTSPDTRTKAIASRASCTAAA